MGDSIRDLKDVRPRAEKFSLGHAALALGLILVGMGQTLLYTLLGPATREIGLSELQTGTIVSASALAVTVSSPFWGRHIDRVGSRSVFLFGMLSYSIGSIAFALVLDAGSHGIISAAVAFLSLTVIRIIYAFMTAGIHPAAMANIALTTPMEIRPARMALMAACFGVGAALGPLLGGALGGYGFFISLYTVSFFALLSVLFGFVALQSIEEKKVVVSTVSKKIAIGSIDSAIAIPLVATVLIYISFSSFQQSISFYVQDALNLSTSSAIKQAGIVISGFSGAMVFTQLVILQCTKFTSIIMVRVGVCLAMIGLIGVASVENSLYSMTMAAVICGVGFAFIFPGLQGVLSSLVSESEQGSVAGLLFGAAALGYVVGPLIGTGLLSVSAGATYWCASILVMLGGGIVWRR